MRCNALRSDALWRKYGIKILKSVTPPRVGNTTTPNPTPKPYYRNDRPARDTTGRDQKTPVKYQDGCFNCGDRNHQKRDCPQPKTFGRATFTIQENESDSDTDTDTEPILQDEDQGNEEAMQTLPGEI